MKTKLNLIKLLACCSVLLTSFSSQLSFAQGKTALVIPEFFYSHPTLLNQAYYQHWLAKGPALEQAIKQQANSLQVTSAQSTTWCGENNQANVIVSLEPHLFYNPQSRFYYAKITAKAYQSNTSHYAALQPFLTLKQETRLVGDLMSNADFFIQKVYTQTAAKLFEQLQQSTDYLKAIDGQEIDDTAGLCAALKQSPPSTRYY